MKRINTLDLEKISNAAPQQTDLLLPALELFDKVVVPLGDLVELCVHAALEVNEVLPCLKRVARVLIPLANDLIEMSH